MPRYASSAQIRAARALLGWTVSELAERLGMSRQTVAKLEISDETRNVGTRERIQSLLERNGVKFLDDDHDGGEGVRFLGRVDAGKRSEKSK